MGDDRDTVELSGSPAHAGGSSGQRPATRPESRAYLGLHFACAGAYVRAHRNRQGTAYQGRCPRCGRTVSFRIGAGGTSDRFFTVRC